MKKIAFPSILLGSFLLMSLHNASANIRLPAFFSDHMVLQANENIPIWGTTKAKTTLSITFNNQNIKTKSDAKGKWRVELPSMPTNATPQDLKITGDGNVTISDVLIGEVWFCSGQSNMGFKLPNANGGAEAVANSEDALLRNFNVKAEGSPTPQENCEGSWQSASPQTASSFSAVAYFFARQLRKDLGVPVGIIHASVGGTPIEAWSRRSALEKIPFMTQVLRDSDTKIAATPEVGNVLRKSTPSWLFNGYINPAVGYGIRGFVWYQGESNVDNAWQYRTLFPALINDWRKLWGGSKQPFLFVQLASRDTTQDESHNSPTAELREAQALTESLPNTAMIVNIDTRAPDWHPLEKETPAKRLATAALELAYNRKGQTHQGPRYVDMKRTGNRIDIRFSNADGLKSTGDSVLGFTISDASGKFVPAQAKIVGNIVEVQSPSISEPVAVRYGWSRGPQSNLINADGLPTAPFRTDNWAGATWPKTEKTP